jgi:hypothetical protein
LGAARDCAEAFAKLAPDAGQQFTPVRGDMSDSALIAGGLVPMQRWGKPEDLGLAVSSVLTGHFPFSTGGVFNIDGGFLLRRL